jgi:hypothetical protein
MRRSLHSILPYVVLYLLWLANFAVCVVAVIQLRAAVNVLLAVLGRDQYSLSLVGQLIVFVGGLAAFIYVVFLESYYRDSLAEKVTTGRQSAAASWPEAASWRGRLARWLAGAGLLVLLRRFALTTAIPLVILILSQVLLEIALRLVHA